jgi:hypothetical protein
MHQSTPVQHATLLTACNTPRSMQHGMQHLSYLWCILRYSDRTMFSRSGAAQVPAAVSGNACLGTGSFGALVSRWKRSSDNCTRRAFDGTAAEGFQGLTA